MFITLILFLLIKFNWLLWAHAEIIYVQIIETNQNNLIRTYANVFYQIKLFENELNTIATEDKNLLGKGFTKCKEQLAKINVEMENNAKMPRHFTIKIKPVFMDDDGLMKELAAEFQSNFLFDAKNSLINVFLNHDGIDFIEFKSIDNIIYHKYCAELNVKLEKMPLTEYNISLPDSTMNFNELKYLKYSNRIGNRIANVILDHRNIRALYLIIKSYKPSEERIIHLNGCPNPLYVDYTNYYEIRYDWESMMVECRLLELIDGADLRLNSWEKSFLPNKNGEAVFFGEGSSNRSAAGNINQASNLFPLKINDKMKSVQTAKLPFALGETMRILPIMINEPIVFARTISSGANLLLYNLIFVPFGKRQILVPANNDMSQQRNYIALIDNDSNNSSSTTSAEQSFITIPFGCEKYSEQKDVIILGNLVKFDFQAVQFSENIFIKESIERLVKKGQETDQRKKLEIPKQYQVLFVPGIYNGQKVHFIATIPNIEISSVFKKDYKGKNIVEIEDYQRQSTAERGQMSKKAKLHKNISNFVREKGPTQLAKVIEKRPRKNKYKQIPVKQKEQQDKMTKMTEMMNEFIRKEGKDQAKQFLMEEKNQIFRPEARLGQTNSLAKTLENIRKDKASAADKRQADWLVSQSNQNYFQNSNNREPSPPSPVNLDLQLGSPAAGGSKLQTTKNKTQQNKEQFRVSQIDKGKQQIVLPRMEQMAFHKEKSLAENRRKSLQTFLTARKAQQELIPNNFFQWNKETVGIVPDKSLIGKRASTNKFGFRKFENINDDDYISNNSKSTLIGKSASSRSKSAFRKWEKGEPSNHQSANANDEDNERAELPVTEQEQVRIGQENPAADDEKEENNDARDS